MFPYDIKNGTVVLPPPEPFPTTFAVSVSKVAVVGVVLLVYLKKRKR
jgi:hypothetical protein